MLLATGVESELSLRRYESSVLNKLPVPSKAKSAQANTPCHCGRAQARKSLPSNAATVSCNSCVTTRNGNRNSALGVQPGSDIQCG